MIRRSRQPRQRQRPVRHRELRPETLARPPQRTRQQRTVVERKTVLHHTRPALRRHDVPRPQHFLQRPVLHQLHREPLAQKRLPAVHRRHDRRAQLRRRPVHELLDEHLVNQFARGRHALPAAPHQHVFMLRRRKPPAVAPHRAPERREEKRHRLHGPFQHQRAGHAGIVLEMPFEKPVGRRDRPHRPEIPAAPRPARRLERRDLVQKTHPPRLDPRRPRVRLRQLEARPEALPRPPGRKGLHLRRAERPPPRRHCRHRPPRATQSRRGLRCRVPNHAVRIRQFLVGEKPRLPVPHA